MSDYVEVQAHERNGKPVKEHVRRKDGAEMTEQDWETYYAEKAGDFLQSVAKDESGTGEILRTTPARGSDVSSVSDLCESAMASDSSIDEISRAISETHDLNRILCLRGLQKEEIKNTLNGWRAEFHAFVSGKLGSGDFQVVKGNHLGNSSRSDLLVMVDGEVVMDIESKFGSATNAAVGVKRASEIMNTESFNLTGGEKALLLEEYSSKGEESSLALLTQSMLRYAEEFNSKPITPNSRMIYDAVKSSGKAGNSEIVKDYFILNFRVSNGEPEISESLITLRPDEVWEAKCTVTVSENTARLAYHLKSSDGQKRMKILFNNKNSTYAAMNHETGMLEMRKKNSVPDLVRIPSKLQMGSGSYNVWYSEGITND